MGVPNGYTSAQVVQAVPTGINSALVLITSGTLSGDTTFSNVFSSTYRNYFVTINNPAVSSNASVAVSIQVGGQTSNYSNAQFYGNYTTNGINGLEFGSASTTKWDIGYTAGSGIDELSVFQFILYNPFENKRTVIQNQNTYAIATLQIGTGTHSAQTSYSEMKVLSGSSTFNAGLVNIYGMSLS